MSTRPLKDVFLGRQPIYGRALELYAYELLYRGADVDFADFVEGDRATSQVLLNTFTEFGLEQIVGHHLAFVNLTRGYVIGEYPLPVPRDRVVLEILEDVPPDEEVLAGLKHLRDQGFRIALDDFVFCEENEPLLPHADIVKVDVLGLGESEIREKVKLLSPFEAELLAEKIETREQFEHCLDAGFDYFQGYFLSRPNVVKGTSLPNNRLNLLRLLAELQDTACDMGRVQEIVSMDVTLSYKLLRHINAAIYGMPRKIESIRETVMYLGLETVKNLACLFLLSDLTDTPNELIVTAMFRAKMCERLSRARRDGQGSVAFTAGLFSILDAMMGLPMPHVLSRLPISAELRSALLDHEGELGEILRCTLAYERGEWEGVHCQGLTRGAIKGAFLQTVEWTSGVDGEIQKAS